MGWVMTRTGRSGTEQGDVFLNFGRETFSLAGRVGGHRQMLRAEHVGPFLNYGCHGFSKERLSRVEGDYHSFLFYLTLQIGFAEQLSKLLFGVKETTCIL